MTDLKELFRLGRLTTNKFRQHSGRSKGFYPILDALTGEQLFGRQNITHSFLSLMSVCYLDGFKAPEFLNAANVFRLGALLVAWILGIDSRVIASEVEWFLGQLDQYRANLPEAIKRRFQLIPGGVVIRFDDEATNDN
jgi:hypothetical protein